MRVPKIKERPVIANDHSTHRTCGIRVTQHRNACGHYYDVFGNVAEPIVSLADVRGNDFDKAVKIVEKSKNSSTACLPKHKILSQWVCSQRGRIPEPPPTDAQRRRDAAQPDFDTLARAHTDLENDLTYADRMVRHREEQIGHMKQLIQIKRKMKMGGDPINNVVAVVPRVHDDLYHDKHKSSVQVIPDELKPLSQQDKLRLFERNTDPSVKISHGEQPESALVGTQTTTRGLRFLRQRRESLASAERVRLDFVTSMLRPESSKFKANRTHLGTVILQ
eukprot:PhM_4_TR15745/c0_g1_i1/m.91930